MTKPRPAGPRALPQQSRLTNERKTALKLVNATRAAQKPPLPPLIVPLKAVPAEPAPYSGINGVTADAISRYKTGPKQNLFYFDYHYVASADNLHVLVQGTGKCAERDGRWQSVNQWQANGGIRTARTWMVNTKYNSSYGPNVNACTPPKPK